MLPYFSRKKHVRIFLSFFHCDVIQRTLSQKSTFRDRVENDLRLTCHAKNLSSLIFSNVRKNQVGHM